MRFIFILKFFLLISFAAVADTYLPPNLRTEAQALSQKFKFYGQFSKNVHSEPLKKYCDMPSNLAREYLNKLQKTAEIVPTDAYTYGMLIGFAPCLKKNIDDAVYYLELASHDNISEASFLIGVISLQKKAVNAAQKYFTLSAQGNYAEAYYNLGLLESKNLKYINKKTIDFFKSASMSGNFKAQHDYAVIMLKLFLNGRVGMQDTQIIHFQNIFNNIGTHTNDTELMNTAKDNLQYLMTLKSKFIIADKNPPRRPQPFNKKTDDIQQKPKSTKIAFGDFEKQGFKDFEDYINYENQLFSGSYN